MKKIFLLIAFFACKVCSAQSVTLPVTDSVKEVFNVTTIFMSVSGTDFQKGYVYFDIESHDSTKDHLDTSLYISRTFVKSAKVKVPIGAFASAFTNGKLNVPLFNQYLRPFGLKVDTVSLRNWGTSIYP